MIKIAIYFVYSKLFDKISRKNNCYKEIESDQYFITIQIQKNIKKKKKKVVRQQIFLKSYSKSSCLPGFVSESKLESNFT